MSILHNLRADIRRSRLGRWVRWYLAQDSDWLTRDMRVRADAAWPHEISYVVPRATYRVFQTVIVPGNMHVDFNGSTFLYDGRTADPAVYVEPAPDGFVSSRSSGRREFLNGTFVPWDTGYSATAIVLSPNREEGDDAGR